LVIGLLFESSQSETRENSDAKVIHVWAVVLIAKDTFASCRRCVRRYGIGNLNSVDRSRLLTGVDTEHTPITMEKPPFLEKRLETNEKLLLSVSPTTMSVAKPHDDKHNKTQEVRCLSHKSLFWNYLEPVSQSSSSSSSS
jgi:hypothetical protein